LGDFNSFFALITKMLTKSIPSFPVLFGKLHLWCQKNTKICNSLQTFGLESGKRPAMG